MACGCFRAAVKALIYDWWFLYRVSQATDKIA